jgi:excisionase family DNA binding protein
MLDTRMSLTEAVRLTGVDASELRDAIKAGKLAAIKPSRDWLVYLVDVQRYIKANNVKLRPVNTKRRKYTGSGR